MAATLSMAMVCIWYPAIIDPIHGMTTAADDVKTRKYAWCVLIGLPTYQFLLLPLVRIILALPVKP